MNFKFNKTKIKGCFEILPTHFSDERGAFLKTYNKEIFRFMGLGADWVEHYYSTSKAGVLRGLHFQKPPHDHAKLVYCVSGAILDIVLDIRVGSLTYGQFIQMEISASKGNMLYMPPGVAHGFCTDKESATVMYQTTSLYNEASDDGILWSSAGISWPLRDPIVSERDAKFQSFENFISPFSLIHQNDSL